MALAASVEGTKELLVFYVRLLRAQSQVYQYCLTSDLYLSGNLDHDLTTLRPAFAGILWAAEEAGPQALVEQAREIKKMAPQEIDRMLLDYWSNPTGTEFFAKAFLQPYGQYIASFGRRQPDQHERVPQWLCPCCAGKPQLSVLQYKQGGPESGSRDLMCAKCLSMWPFRRAVCAHCGEEQPTQLAYFQPAKDNHVRVEACDTCRHYLKGIDLTRLPDAAVLVDEVAAAPLDLWATEHGYTKIELNLVGL
jgi:formate dehydrogenase accessory protein FdhE